MTTISDFAEAEQLLGAIWAGLMPLQTADIQSRKEDYHLVEAR